MTKWTLPLSSSREIELPKRISLNSEIIIILRFSRHWVLGGTWKAMCHNACLYKTHGKPFVNLHGM